MAPLAISSHSGTYSFNGPLPPAKESLDQSSEKKPSSSRSGTAEDHIRKSGRAEDTVSLSEQELAQVRQLAARDREVRAHEAAHAAVAARYASHTSFTRQRGPDGRSYAVGGEVSLDTTPVAGDPQATLEKAQTIRAAALAPLHPSSTDRNVAARASRMAADAQTEILNAKKTATSSASSPASSTTAILASDQPTPVDKALDIYG